MMCKSRRVRSAVVVGVLALTMELGTACSSDSSSGADTDTLSGADTDTLSDSDTDNPEDSDTLAFEMANELVEKLTLEDKIALVTGTSIPKDDKTKSAGYIEPIVHDDVDIPALHLGDGPNGVGNGNTGVTQFPPAISLAASWDIDLAKSYGEALGAEWHGKGINVGLAPGMNITRIVYNGRTGEYLGEDPWLTGQIATNVVQGIQSQNVIATVKHYALNNQETDRSGGDSIATDRTMREIYLPAFEMAIKEGGAGAVMCSYNRVNGTYACENPFLLDEVLRNDWGFMGFVMSDWFALHSTAPAALAGMDMDMPGKAYAFAGLPYYYGSKLKDAVQSDQVSSSVLDTMARRILFAMYRNGLFENRVEAPEDDVSTKEHKALALRISEEGSVLLQNKDGVLPLAKSATVAVIGPAAEFAFLSNMPGSGQVSPSEPIVSPLSGILDEVGADKVTYERGSYGWVGKPTLSSKPADPGYGDLVTPSDGAAGLDYTVTDNEGGEVLGAGTSTAVNYGFCASQFMGQEPCSFGSWPIDALQSGTVKSWTARFEGVLKVAATATYAFNISGSGHTLVRIDGATVAEVTSGTTASQDFEAPLAAETEYLIEITVDTSDYSWPMFFQGLAQAPTAILTWNPDPTLMTKATEAAASADVAVVVVGDYESEGEDHTAFLPDDQDELVRAVAAAAKKTVVVLNSASALMLPWADEVDAILQNWLGGQRMGTAVAHLLYGDVNPSGKTVATFATSEDQYYAQESSQYPGVPTDYPDGTFNKVSYDEGIFVGYRWFDQNEETPRFPFGHGLSYTTFDYKDLNITPESGDGSTVTVQATITNSGEVAGKEVVQLYVGFPAEANEPPRQLKGFQKVAIEPGKSEDVTFSLDSRALSYWDETDGWKVAKGVYAIMVGGSSRDIQLNGKYVVE